MHPSRSSHRTGPTALVVLGGLALTLAPGGCGFRIEPDPAFTGSGGGASQARPIRDEATNRLFALSTSPTPQIRANAIEGLQRVGPRAEPTVALALSDENPGVRSVAAMVAGRAGLTALIPTLREMARDESGFVRASSIAALNRLGQKADPTELSTMLLESPNPRLRAHAAFLIGEMGEQSALPMLRQAWVTPIRTASEIERRLVRLQVVEAMVKLGDQSSIDTLRAALYPSRPDELEATALAVQIIGEVRDRGSIDQLIYLADDSDDRVMPAEVRLAVAGALAKMGLTQGGFIADEYAGSPIDVVRAQAAAVYGRTGRTEHLPSLGVMLDDPSELVQVAAAAAVVDLMSGGAQADAGTP